MPAEIVLPRRYGLVVGMFLAGLLFVSAGLYELGRVSWGAEVFFFALGAPLVIVNGRTLIVRSPSLRANESGLWFGGGAIIPWSDVKQIYESATNVRMYGVTTRVTAVAIDFERKRTLFRLPITLWLVAPFTVGDVVVSASGASGSTIAIVARLEAMRGAARAA